MTPAAGWLGRQFRRGRLMTDIDLGDFRPA